MATDGRLYNYKLTTSYKTDGMMEQMSSDLGLNIATNSSGDKYFYFGEDSTNGFIFVLSGTNVFYVQVINGVVGGTDYGFQTNGGVYARATENAVIFCGDNISPSFSYTPWFACAKGKNCTTQEEEIVYFGRSRDTDTSSGSTIGGNKVRYWSANSTATKTQYFPAYAGDFLTDYLGIYPVIIGNVRLHNIFFPFSQGYYDNNTLRTESGTYVAVKTYAKGFFRPYMKL